MIIIIPLIIWFVAALMKNYFTNQFALSVMNNAEFSNKEKSEMLGSIFEKKKEKINPEIEKVYTDPIVIVILLLILIVLISLSISR